MTDEQRLKICFVAPGAYAVLSGDPAMTGVGGAEVQQTLLARELVRRGHEVSMICLDHGQPDGIVLDGIKVFRSHTPHGGWPVVRFLHPRLSSTWQAMRRADADVYYQRAASALTGMVVAFARWRKRAVVFAAASDMDFHPSLPWVQYARDRLLFRWGVRNATRLIVQSRRQQEDCRRVFGLDADCVQSVYAHQGLPGRLAGPILWVGTVKGLKRPEIFVDLARRFPQYRFRMIGGGEATVLQSVVDRAKGLSNLDIVGFVPYTQIEAQFDGAALIVNTSIAEGFPNTFLQAWSRGIPSLSIFDPGKLADGRQIAPQVRSIDDLFDWLPRMMQPEQWALSSVACLQAFRERFTPEASVGQCERVLQQAVQATRRACYASEVMRS